MKRLVRDVLSHLQDSGELHRFSLTSISSEIIKLCKAMSDLGSTMLYHKTNMGVGLRVAEQLS